MNVQDLFYHGIRNNIRRVVVALGEERTDKGLTAFEDGSHDWGNCFFARAFKGEFSLTQTWDPETKICNAIGLLSADGQPNKVPVRLVWRTFDGASPLIKAAEMKQLIIDIRDETRPAEVMHLLRSLKLTDAVADTDKPVVAHACVV